MCVAVKMRRFLRGISGSIITLLMKNLVFYVLHARSNALSTMCLYTYTKGLVMSTKWRVKELQVFRIVTQLIRHVQSNLP